MSLALDAIFTLPLPLINAPFVGEEMEIESLGAGAGADVAVAVSLAVEVVGVGELVDVEVTAAVMLKPC